MADAKGRSTRRRLRYFYVKVEGEPHLHKVLHITRAQDLVLAWDYVLAKRVQYIWSDVKKTMQNAFTVTETAEILNRHRMTIDHYIRDGFVKKPQMTYNLSTRNPVKYMLSEDDVLAMHQVLSEQHRGRPRNDGYITTVGLPTRAEVKALVQHNQVLYTKDDEGNFVPIWKEQVW